MSGLVNYFHTFLSNKSQELEPQEEKTVTHPVNYEHSILAFHSSSTIVPHNNNNNSTHRTHNGDDSNTMDYVTMWNQRKANLKHFFNCRLGFVESDVDIHSNHPNEGETKEYVSPDNNENGDYVDDNDDNKNDDNGFETQDHHVVRGNIHATRRNNPWQPITVCPVSETLESVSNISEIDIYASKVQINLCRVGKFWGIRQTRRNWDHPSNNHHHAPYCFGTIDGPWNVWCKQVLSFEIQQCFETAATELHKRTEQLHNLNPCHTCQVFCYDKYALQLDQLRQRIHILSSKDKRKKCTTFELYMALHNIPPTCIMPRDTNGSSCTDWYSQRMPSYTLNFTDRTFATRYTSVGTNDKPLDTEANDTDEDTRIRVRLDNFNNDTRYNNEDIRLDFLLVDDGKPVIEYRLGPSTICDSGLTTYKNMDGTSPIQQSFKEFCANELMPGVDYHENEARTKNSNDSGGMKTNGTDLFATNRMANRSTFTRETIDPSKRLRINESHEIPKRQRIETVLRQYHAMKDYRLLLENHRGTVDPGRKSPDCTIDFYAVVLSFTQPWRTKRGDWTMSLVLVDESLDLYENIVGNETKPFLRSTAMNIFEGSSSKDSLPQVRYAGDVLRVHGAVLQLWNVQYQLMGKGGKCTTVVFRGNVHDPEITTECNIYPPSDDVTGEDSQRVLGLWKWGQRRLRLHATMKAEHSFKLSQMHSTDNQQMAVCNRMDSNGTTRGDLTAMITAILPMDQRKDVAGISPCGFLRLWDGTGPPLSDRLPRNIAVERMDIDTGDPSSVVLVKIAKVIKKIQKIHQNPDLQPPKRLTGRVVSAVVWERQHWEFVEENVVSVGTFIRLRNIQDSKMKDEDSCCLMVHGKSSFTPLPDLTYEVVGLLEDHNNRLLQHDPVNPRSGVLPLGEESCEELIGPTNHLTTMAIQKNIKNSHHILATTSAKLQKFALAPTFSVYESCVRLIGIHPTQQVLSSRGLQQICRPRKCKSLEDTHCYFFGLQIQEDASSFVLDCLVLESSGVVGQQIFGMSASAVLANKSEALHNLHSIMTRKPLWKARIHSFAHVDMKFFCIDSINDVHKN